MGFESFHAPKTEADVHEAKDLTRRFESQWNSPKDVEIAGEHFDLYDVSPENPKTDVPVAIMPGWTHTPEVWKKNAQVLVGNGRRVMSLNAPHGVENNMENVPAAEARRAGGFLGMLDSQNIQKADAIGHSEGAIDVLLAAREHPEKFRTLVLINPGGLIGADSFVDLMGRFMHEKARALARGIREGELSAMKTPHLEGGKSAIANPARAFQEVLAIARADLVHLLRDIKERGVHIVIIHSPEDPVFPFLRMSKEIHEQKRNEDRLGDLPQGQDGEILKLVDGVYSVKGGHEEFIYKAEEYTRLAEAALRAMEQRKKNI